jgi:very-short-patch-repair endonuclease
MEMDEDKLPRNIVWGRRVKPSKKAKARQLRSDMTQAEGILWQSLRANRLDGLHFRRQQLVFGFIVDFYCHAARLIIEVDGSIHGDQLEWDAERQVILEQRGFCVVRFTNDAVVHRLPVVLQEIRDALTQRISGTPSP